MSAARRLRIAHVAAVYPPYWSGTSNVAYHNALEVARRGHDVHVFTAAYPLDGYRDPPELTVHRLPVWWRLGNAALTPDLLRGLHGFDLVHLHWPCIFGAELTWLACALRRTPYVVSYLMDLNAGRRRVFGPYQALCGPLVVRGARLVLAGALDHLRASLIWPTLARGRVPVVEQPHGVDTRRFHPSVDGRAVRARHGLPQDATVVGFVGAMDAAHEFKGVPELLRALAALRAPAPHALLVGDGDLAPGYRGLAHQLGLAGRVRWAGRVGDAELPAHYAAFDVLAFPSLAAGAEAFGLVAIEAMASGKPVVASRLPGVRTVVDHERTGLLVTPGAVDELAAAIARLADDPAERARFGAAGRHKTETQYDWAALGARLEQHYLAALGDEADRQLGMAFAASARDKRGWGRQPDGIRASLTMVAEDSDQQWHNATAGLT